MKPLLGSLLGLTLFGLALSVLHRELASITWASVAATASATPWDRLALALALTAASYLLQTNYDRLALRQIGHPVPWRALALPSLQAQVLSQNLGVALLTGGSVRARTYAAQGLGAAEIAQALAHVSATFWLGFAGLAGLTWALLGGGLPTPAPLSGPGLQAIGGLLLLGPLAWVSLGLWRREPLVLRGHALAPPQPRLALEQLLSGVVDWAAASFVVIALLPAGPPPGQALALVLLAHVLASASQSPGGVGVFETALVLLLKPWARAEEVLAAAVLYRLIYYLGPLLLTALALGVSTWRAHSRRALVLGRALAQQAAGWTPTGMAVMTFTAGAILFTTGALPAEAQHLAWMRDLFPLPLVESSHFIGSLIGCALMLLARALQRRLAVARWVSLGLLSAGMAAALLRGGDLPEASVLALTLAALLSARGAFYRRAALFEDRFTPAWLLSAAAVVGATVWVGLVAYRHVDYAPELWWQFSWSGDAPRFLRGTLTGAVMIGLFGASRLLAPAQPAPDPPTAEALTRAEGIAREAARSDAWLALLGDKRLLFNEAGTAFVMYGIQGRSWVAMGDPVGPEAEAAELAWAFRELALREGGRPVFYQVGPGSLPLHIDMGFVPFKIGEEARVPLEGFSLEGKARKKLRSFHNKLSRAGAVFEVVERADVPALMPTLRAISDDWLGGKNVREKGFSLGRFEEGYLSHFRVATVRVEGEVVAFANLWEGGGRGELSIDLMRFSEAAPSGVMEFLFVSLMLWGAEQGWRWFNLGSVPLAGMQDRPEASAWSRAGALTFEHGEYFYNFEGLRAYKDKFDPEWEPRYLMVPSPSALAPALLDVVALTSGGLGGALKR
ncbi:MAG: bifunctional lysylphosphatidylglycerol flippase/synthetase MprF [Alphaproteobacteria bacterium]|nr:bifunctional lysylphosphatidylglycerol flippase/synthetase MprF [Alphaproteobacteria bacterium]